MGTHESSVNFENLIRDLAEMYPFEVAEVVLVELVANSLDAKPTRIWIDFDQNTKVLVVTDNGHGMSATDFDQYHDFAAGLKRRGSGIGFAGVGAKVSFNIATRVVTETQSSSFSGGSNWYLQSKRKLIWDDIQPTRLNGRGTRVEVVFAPNASLPYSRDEDFVRLLFRHYLPLFDTEFLTLYERLGFYSGDLRFIVNGNLIDPCDLTTQLKLEQVRRFVPKKGGKGIGLGILGLSKSEYPIGADICGALLCTHGKVVKPDFFNQFPGAMGPRIIGLVEIPSLIDFLTTAKTDFIRRKKLREFESLYDPVRQEFKSWLSELGIESPVVAATDDAMKLERELKKLLDDVPELSEFFGFRTKKPILQTSTEGTVIATTEEGVESTFPFGEGEGGEGPGPLDVGDQPGEAIVEDRDNGTQTAKPVSRVGRRGPKITFNEAPDKVELAWVEGSNVVINSGHPSYVKVRSDFTARKLHSLFAIAGAVQRFLTSEGISQDMTFVDRMMTAWGNK